MKCVTTTRSIGRALNFIFFFLLINIPTLCAFSRRTIQHYHTTTCMVSSLQPMIPQRKHDTKLLEGRERRSSSHIDGDKSCSSKQSFEESLLASEESARQIRSGQAKQRLEKAVRREDRIAELEQKAALPRNEEHENIMSEAEVAELKGLLKVRENFEEQYDPLTFTKEHLEFKAMHNDALIALVRYCERTQSSSSLQQQYTKEVSNIFVLDGPDGGTTSALIDRGEFDANQCFVANRHILTCDALKLSGGGRLLEKNVVHATAAEALTMAADSANPGEGGALSNIDFRAYYFDGCGGFYPHIINMLSAALIRKKFNVDKPIAVGYSLLGGNKNVVEKELAVSRALTIIARNRGMRMVHVLDDPVTYGISADIKKIGGSEGGGGGTFTTWHILEPER